MEPDRIGDGQYEDASVYWLPLVWDHPTLGTWRQQCNDEGILDRPRELMRLPSGQEWDGEETLPERW